MRDVLVWLEWATTNWTTTDWRHNIFVFCQKQKKTLPMKKNTRVPDVAQNIWYCTGNIFKKPPLYSRRLLCCFHLLILFIGCFWVGLGLKAVPPCYLCAEVTWQRSCNAFRERLQYLSYWLVVQTDVWGFHFRHNGQDEFWQIVREGEHNYRSTHTTGVVVNMAELCQITLIRTWCCATPHHATLPCYHLTG